MMIPENYSLPEKVLLTSTSPFQVLESSMQWLDNWEMAMIKGEIDSDEFLTKETAEGLRLSLRSTMDLYRYMIERYGFQYLLTGKVNQDNLKVVFS